MNMKANTLTIDPVDAEGWQQTAGVLSTLQEQEAGGIGDLLTGGSSAGGAALGGPYGGLVQGAGRVLGGLADSKQPSGAGAGSSIGALAGSAAGTAIGGPLGTSLGGAAGQMLGGLAGSAIDSTQKKPANRQARQQARAR